MEWTVIKKGTELPEDFFNEKNQVNYEKYILQMGSEEEDWWVEDEYSIPIMSMETIGGMILGSSIYHKIRFRKRTENDQPWDIYKNTTYKLMNITL